MVKTTNNKSQKAVKATPNPLETLKDLGKATASQMRQEAKQMPNEIIDQLFGPRQQKNFSGELLPGQAIEFKDVLSGKQEQIEFQRKQISLEKILLQEERIRTEKKTNELKIQLKVLQEELIVLADKTEGLAEETQIAAMQVAVEPGVYHVIFFEKLLEFVGSFRKKIEEASVWLHATNSRASKKNAWGAAFKKHGAKYLLSGEHYVSRSAG
jgi:hypothetical protein